METKQRVAIIGAGPCGLLMGYELLQLKGQASVEFDILQKQSALGGQWNFSGELQDQHGEDVHSSVYDNLWINAPKETVELPMYHFPEGMPSFFSHRGMAEYIRGFASHFQVEHKVQCSQVVERVECLREEDDEKKPQLRLTKRDRYSGEIRTQLYDAVVVATGHFAVPNDVTFPGQESFPGDLIHSHHFRNQSAYKAQRVLVVGGAYSAEDIAVNLYKYGAEHVTIVMRGAPMAFPFPKTVQQKPYSTVIHIEGSTVHFSDGSKAHYDAIIKCTGYKYQLDFLDSALRPPLYKNVLNPPLFQHVVSPQCPQLFFMGMEDQLYTLALFHAQARYIASVLAGRVVLPDSVDMLKWIEQDAEAVAALVAKGKRDKNYYQRDYVNKLSCLAGYEAPPDFACFYLTQFEYKTAAGPEQLLNYRNLQWKSVYSGKEAVKPEKPWLKNK